MDQQENINMLINRLNTHRQTLAHYLQQRAMLGAAYVPPGNTHGVAEARRSIAQLKKILRDQGVDVDDHPDDIEAPGELTIIQEPNRESISQSDKVENLSTVVSFENTNEVAQLVKNAVRNVPNTTKSLVQLHYQLPEPLRHGSCRIEFASRPGLIININHQQILDSLMQGVDTKPEWRLRGFIEPIDERSLEAKLGQIIVMLSVEEARELCDLIDEMCERYKSALIKNEEILESWKYDIVEMEDDEQGLLLFSVDEWLWDLMLRFSHEFDYDEGESIWHVFHRQNFSLRVGRGVDDHVIIYPRSSISDFMLSTGSVDILYVAPDWLRDEYARWSKKDWRLSLGEFGSILPIIDG